MKTEEPFAANSKVNRSRTHTWWRNFKASSAINKANLIASFVIMISTLCYSIIAGIQLYVMSKASEEGTRQTSQLISAAQISAIAANQNAAAAASFSASAHGIRTSMDNAVSQLQAQANATDEVRKSSEQQSAKALETATTNARSDLRAYIVTTMHRAPIKSGCDYAYQHHCIEFQYSNVGRTPAVAIKTTAVLKLDEIPGDSTNENDMRSLTIKRYSGLQGSVLGNSGPGTATATEVGPLLIPHCSTGHQGTRCGYSIFGLIQYKDIFDQYHETGFCTYFIDEGDDAGSSCRYGNWFDVRPTGFFHEVQ